MLKKGKAGSGEMKWKCGGPSGVGVLSADAGELGDGGGAVVGLGGGGLRGWGGEVHADAEHADAVHRGLF